MPKLHILETDEDTLILEKELACLPPHVREALFRHIDYMDQALAASQLTSQALLEMI